MLEYDMWFYLDVGGAFTIVILRGCLEEAV